MGTSGSEPLEAVPGPDLRTNKVSGTAVAEISFPERSLSTFRKTNHLPVGVGTEIRRSLETGKRPVESVSHRREDAANSARIRVPRPSGKLGRGPCAGDSPSRAAREPCEARAALGEGPREANERADWDVGKHVRGRPFSLACQSTAGVVAAVTVQPVAVVTLVASVSRTRPKPPVMGLEHPARA